jgi:hypothetical protein
MALRALILNMRVCYLSKNCIMGILEVSFVKKKEVSRYNIRGKIVSVRSKFFYFILITYLKICLNLFIQKIFITGLVNPISVLGILMAALSNTKGK